MANSNLWLPVTTDNFLLKVKLDKSITTTEETLICQTQ